VAETTTRGWAKSLAGQARRLRARCVDEKAATLGDVEFLTLATEAMADEIERLHGVIRNFQQHGAGGSDA
jgi:hypothetical protein